LYIGKSGLSLCSQLAAGSTKADEDFSDTAPEAMSAFELFPQN